MKIEQKDNSLLFSSTDIPDIFFSEYLPLASGEAVKVYLYINFLAKHGKDVNINELSKILSLSYDQVNQSIKFLEEQGLLIKNPNGYKLTNIQEIELAKLYSPKVTSSIEDIQKSEKSQYRARAIESINTQFFQGLMSPSWYTDIDLWFNKYGFDEQVMIALFSHCADKKALHRNYIQAVADAWSKNKIKTFDDLDEYFSKLEGLNIFKKEIASKLRITRPLTTFEEEYISKWTNEFGYGMDIIEIALKRSTLKANAGFEYYDKLLSDWHSKGLVTVNDVQTHISSLSEKNIKTKQVQKIATQYEYTESIFDSFDNLYDN